jgi:hypothetical protein
MYTLLRTRFAGIVEELSRDFTKFMVGGKKPNKKSP